MMLAQCVGVLEENPGICCWVALIVSLKQEARPLVASRGSRHCVTLELEKDTI